MSLMARSFAHTHAASTAHHQGSPSLEPRGDEEVPEREREREENEDEPGKVRSDRDEDHNEGM